MEFLKMCYFSGISDFIKVGAVVRAPAWMDGAEKRAWDKGKRYALRQQK